MTKLEIYNAVIKVVDTHSNDISLSDYRALMCDLAEDFQSRADAAQTDLANEEDV